MGVSATTTGLIVLALRTGGPLIGRLFGAVVKTRAELDADRDRIIAALRSELADYQRRVEAAVTRANAAEASAASCRQEVKALNEFIDTLMERLGTTRERVENGEPWPRRR
jgi:chromosome segregation ATPase